MKVLLATDGSEAAQRACREIASMLVSERDVARVLTVLSYSEYPYTGVPDWHLADEAERERRVHEEVHRITDTALRTLSDAGFRAEVTHRFGNPTEQIVSEIEQWYPDLVVMGRRGVHGLDRWLGSVSEHVLHHAKVPVLLVP